MRAEGGPAKKTSATNYGTGTEELEELLLRYEMLKQRIAGVRYCSGGPMNASNMFAS